MKNHNTYETVTPTIVGESIEAPYNAGNNNATGKDVMSAYHYFPSSVYMVKKPEFLTVARSVSMNYIKEAKKNLKNPDPLYPIVQTGNMFMEEKLSNLSNYIAQTAWNVLQEQGHNMTGLTTFFLEMWCQEHSRFSNQEEHIHGLNSQIVGFYFLDCPKDGNRVIIHDPRPGRKQVNLPEMNMSDATYASTMINFEAEPGTLLFTNSWLPHSFTRNASKTPSRFIHFSLGVMNTTPTPPTSAVAPTTPQPTII